MSTNLLTAPVQAYIFVLGCVLIDAAREQAVTLTRWLASLAAIMAALTVISAAIVWAPLPQDRLNEVAVHVVIAGQPPGME